MEAPGTNAPLESFTTPRREVVAVWANARVAKERMQQSIHPERDRFTAAPPQVLNCTGVDAGVALTRLADCGPGNCLSVGDVFPGTAQHRRDGNCMLG